MSFRYRVPTLFLLAALALGCGALTAGCGAVQRPKQEPRGTVRFKGTPKDALLSVNELHLGPIHMFEEKGVLLKGGPNRVIVSKEGFFTEYRIIDVTVETVSTIEVSLREIP